MIQVKFGSNWPSGFRGDDFFKSLQTDNGRQVMAIAHTGEVKIKSINQLPNSLSQPGPLFDGIRRITYTIYIWLYIESQIIYTPI
jgi:hypothetical protein